MATYKDILMLVDKVSQPLKKIADNTDKTRKKMQKFTDKVKAFGKGFANMGGKVLNFGKKVIGTFAAIGAAISAAGGAILNFANKYAEMGDRIDKMSQKIGMSIQSFQEWDYILSQNGGNIENLQMGFKTLTNQISMAGKGSKESAAMFKRLGVSIKDNNGNLRKQDDVFNDTITALQKMGETTERDAIGQRLLGRSFVEMKPLLNQTAESIDELRKKANKMGLILSKEDVDNAKNYKDTMDTFSRVFEARFAKVMMKIMPDLTKTLEDIMQIVSENQEVFDNIGLVFKWLATKALPAVIKSLVVIMNLFKAYGEYWGNIIGNILSIPTLIQIAFINLHKNVKITFIKLGRAIASIGGYIAQIFNNVISSIRQWIEWIIEKITWLIGKIPLLNKALENRGGGSRISQTQTNNTYNYNTSNTYNSTRQFAGASNALYWANVPLTT